MKIYKYCLLIILSFILVPITIKGAACSNSEKVAYQSLAKNISMSYEYIEENENTQFYVTFTNVLEGFYLKNLDTKETYYYTGSEMTISGLEQGKNYRYGIYTTYIGCDSIILYTHYLNLPYYNPYYKDELCTGIENFKYCNKWINKKITYEEFKKNVEKYSEKNNDVQEEEKTENIGLFDIIVEFYLKYYILILPIIIISGIIIIRKHNKKHDLF